MKKIAVLTVAFLFAFVHFGTVEAKQQHKKSSVQKQLPKEELPKLDFPMIIVIGDEEMVPVHTTWELLGIISSLKGKDVDFEIVVRERDIKKADEYLEKLGL